MDTQLTLHGPGRRRARGAALALGLLIAGAALLPLAAGAHGRGVAVRTQWHGGAHPGWHAGAGRWEHSWHGGHYGWWYIDGGVWTMYPYFYPYYPYYPYYGYPPAYTYSYPPESTVNNSNLPAPPPSWYYCDAARGYYPNVPACPSGWRAVPATPPPGAPPPQ